MINNALMKGVGVETDSTKGSYFKRFWMGLHNPWAMIGNKKRSYNDGMKNTLQREKAEHPFREAGGTTLLGMA